MSNCLNLLYIIVSLANRLFWPVFTTEKKGNSVIQYTITGAMYSFWKNFHLSMMEKHLCDCHFRNQTFNLYTGEGELFFTHKTNIRLFLFWTQKQYFCPNFSMKIAWSVYLFFTSFLLILFFYKIWRPKKLIA
jgi:hypothetical protein